MIISASRRTDIPAFYAEWMLNRLRLGYCCVPNPFHPAQVSRISLRPEDVEIIVFWTRHAAPLLPYLGELNDLGHRFYFQYTLNNYPPELDGNCPTLDTALRVIQRLVRQVGPGRVIWRYDPIVFTSGTAPRFHAANFRLIARSLNGLVDHCMVSVLDPYRKIRKRMLQLAVDGLSLMDFDAASVEFGELMSSLVTIASDNGMQILSCAEMLDLARYGIKPGKCIDDDFIQKTFSLAVDQRKDPSQRPACGCVRSRDIGMYDTCTFGCRYCYATSSFTRARENRKNHDPASPSLPGWIDAPEVHLRP